MSTTFLSKIGRPPLPLLITGVSGVAGWSALQTLRDSFGDEVIGIRQRKNWRLTGPGIVPCDAEDRDRLIALFREHRFRAVLNCAGNCALRSCELDPAMAWRINHRSVEILLDVIATSDAVRLVHLSIDLVFSGGGSGGYIESDEPDPVTIYGKSMAAAEQLVLQSSENACVARISLPMGPSVSGHAGAIDWIESRFRQGKPATLYYDEIRTPTYTDCLTRACCSLLGSNQTGIVHAGGPRRLSLFQIAQIVNRVGGYPPHLLQGCFRNEAGPLPPRAGNVTLDSRSLQMSLGDARFLPWPVDDRFVPSHPDWHWEQDGWHGDRSLLERHLYRPERFDVPGH